MKNHTKIIINSLRNFIKCLPNAIEKDIVIGDNTATMEIEKAKAYQNAYPLGKSIN